MIVQITRGPPHFPYQLSPREQQIFEHCALAGEIWTGWVTGELEACWGVVPPSFMSDEAYLWFWHLPIRHPILLARYSREVISTLHERWSVLHGHCKINSPSSQRWLKWLGAEFGAPQDEVVSFVLRRA